MPLPHGIARFNKRVTNRFVEPIARQSSGFVVVHHAGRRSGAAYTTPVNAFADGDALIVALTYGPSADWVRNVLASGGSIESGLQCRRIEDVQVVDRAAAWPVLPVVVRAALRVLHVEDFMRLSLEPARGVNALSG